VFLGLPFNFLLFIRSFLKEWQDVNFLEIQGDLKLVHLYDNAIFRNFAYEHKS
jgi:hypothetical protein